MPGFELIGKEEFKEIEHLFKKSGILFRHSFDNLRNNIYKVKEFEKKFAKKMDAPYSLAVTSGTAALRVALAAIDIKPGDEVITQSFTFVATAEAIIECKATPVICEIDKTWDSILLCCFSEVRLYCEKKASDISLGKFSLEA